MSLNKKLLAVQSELTTVDKEGENKFQHYKYVMLGTILESINPLLQKHGLVITQSVTASESRLEFTDSCYYSTASVTVDTKVIEADTSESETITSIGFAADKNSDKAAFKAITGARKYGITMMFKLHWDSVEAEQDTPNISGAKTTRKPPAKAKALNSSDFF